MSERLRRTIALATVALLALASSAVGIVNGYTYDDRYIVAQNPAVIGSTHWWRAFASSYWPADWGGDGYRPLTILAFRVQYAIGHGSPMAFHALNIALYAAIAVLVFLLARELLPEWAAWLVGACYAVHPVHVEAVANVVGQSELVVAAVFLPAVILYLRDRRRGSITLRTGAIIALLYVVACLSKEHGVVLPAVLVGAELTVLGGDAVLQRLRDHRLRIFYLTLGAIGLAFIGVRGAVLWRHGLGGFQPFTPFSTLHTGARDRILTAIGIVPQWVRLFYWPLHLSSDYGPPGTEIAQGFSIAQLPGALILVGVLAFGVLLARRRPVISFGIGFVVVTLLPSSNFIMPAGIVLAERTLLLPTVGAMLILGDLAVLAAERLRSHASWQMVRTAAVALAGAAILICAWRSSQRTEVWYDNTRLFNQMVIDAPLSYRAHYMRGAWSFELKRQREGEEEYQTAIKLFPYDPYVSYNLAEQYLKVGMCKPAVPLYRWSRAIDPDFPLGRTHLASCLLEVGKYDDAKEMAFQAMRAGGSLKLLRRMVFIADSAKAAEARPLAGSDGSPNSGKKHEIPQKTARAG